MIIGCPKEIKTREYRVGLVPGGVAALTGRGHQVLIEKGAGVGSGIADALYEVAGGKIVEKAADVWARAEMIVKVKEPMPSEYALMREGQTVYTYFHLAADKPLYGVNHLAAHVAVDTLEHGALPEPAIALLVSGGHSSLLRVDSLAGDVQPLGATIDDAAGEAFDKVARLLGMPFPGGPPIDRAARAGDPAAIAFPRGLTAPRDLAAHRFDFSFSGLKTAVARWVEARQRSGEPVPVNDAGGNRVGTIAAEQSIRPPSSSGAVPRADLFQLPGELVPVSLELAFEDIRVTPDPDRIDITGPNGRHLVTAVVTPSDLMQARVEGRVILYAVIHADGTVGEVRVLQSLDDRLDENAKKAIARWHFRPATKNGNPVDLEAVVQIPFAVKKSPYGF